MPEDENKQEMGGGLDHESEESELVLKSKDEQTFSVDRKSAFISRLVKTATEQDPSTTEVPILGVKGDILKEVVNYMNHHKGTEPPIVEKPLRNKDMSQVCKDKWDATFIDEIGEDRQKIYDLILAANYMDIKSLLHLGCAKVASLIKGQPLEKIKEILSVERGNDEKKASE